MIAVRKAAVAGLFYPKDPQQLEAAVQAYLQENACTGDRPKALIAPHAGFIYSGPIAGSAYSLLDAEPPLTERVVLIGPSHRVGFRGMAVPTSKAFETPLGSVAVDMQGVAAALECPEVHQRDDAHAQEHGLEVQLPFLLAQIPSPFSIIPIVVGNATGAEVAAVLNRLWGGAETLIVVSSDLSHYHDYQTARTMDAETSAAIEALDPDRITPDQACGQLAIQGLLHGARERGMQARLLDLRNSGDTAGKREEVVGYGAYVVS